MSNQISRGLASLVVPAAALAETVMALPRSYTIVGSRQSRVIGEVILEVASDDVADGEPRLRLEMSDAGSTRIIRVLLDTDRRT